MRKLQTTRQTTLQTALLTLVALLFLSAKCEEGDLGIRNIDNNDCYYNIYDSNDTDNISEGTDKMKNIETQIDDSTHLSAADFNQIPEELENLIESSDQTLSESDLTQSAKAIATYAGASYFATGSSTAYEALIDNDLKLPAGYVAGFKMDVLLSEENTSVNTTLKLGTLAALPISNKLLANGETPLVVIGELKAYSVVSFVYIETPDGLLKYWLVVGTSLSQIKSGKTSIDTSSSTYDYNTTIETDNISYYAHSITQTISSKTTDASRTTSMQGGSLTTQDTNDADESLESRYDEQGIRFRGDRDPSDEDPIFRKSVLDMSGLTTLTFSPIVDDNSNELPMWRSSAVVDLKIPSTCDILGATANYDNASSNKVTSPVVLTSMVNSGTTWTGFVTVLGSSVNIAPPRYNNMKLYIEFDATNL